MNCITLNYGAADPLILECANDALVADCRGPEGVKGESAHEAVAAALVTPPEGPPLASQVVPGDRVVIAQAGSVPQAAAVVAAVAEQLRAAGVQPEDMALLQPSGAGTAAGGCGSGGPDGPVRPVAFDPAVDAETAYLAADESGRPLYLARALVDADVVVAVGSWGFDASLGGRSLDGELWPTFARLACRHDVARSLARKGRLALPEWRESVREITWQLGVCASLRIVAGRDGSVGAAAFGLPEAAARLARRRAVGWSPQVEGSAALTIVTLAEPRGGFAAVTRAVAAAARVTRAGGTICVASRLNEPPGIVFSRWRQGAPLVPLVREAVGTGDPTMIAEAVQTRLFAHALGDRRIVLLSDLGEGVVEDLEFGHAATPEVIERLAHRSDRLIVLREADLMLPRIMEP